MLITLLVRTLSWLTHKLSHKHTHTRRHYNTIETYWMRLRMNVDIFKLILPTTYTLSVTKINLIYSYMMNGK